MTEVFEIGQADIIKIMWDNGNGWFKLEDLKSIVNERLKSSYTSRIISRMKWNRSLIYDAKKCLYKLNMDDYTVKQVLGQQGNIVEYPSIVLDL